MSNNSGCFSYYFDAQLLKITKVFVFPLILFVIFIIILVGVYKLALLLKKKKQKKTSQPKVTKPLAPWGGRSESCQLLASALLSDGIAERLSSPGPELYQAPGGPPGRLPKANTHSPFPSSHDL